MWIAVAAVVALLVGALVVYLVRVRQRHVDEFKREPKGFTRFARPMHIPMRQGFRPLPDNAPTGAIFELAQKPGLAPDVRVDTGEMSADQEEEP